MTKEMTVSRPRGVADLAGRRVGIWGYGVEGRASETYLRSRVGELVLVDDQPHDEHVLATSDGGLDALAECDVVLKSPGIPRRRADVMELESRGVVMTSTLALWLADADRSRIAMVTGTKGKSSVTSLMTFIINAAGLSARSAGNIGVPPYALEDDGGYLIIETSSFQAVDVNDAPAVVVVTSLGADHLDWHGDITTYHRDKLSLTSKPGEHATVVSDDVALRDAHELLGGDVTWVSAGDSELREALGLVGTHNERNVQVALVAASALTGLPLDVLRQAAIQKRDEFTPLAGRLTVVARRDGVTFIDDGLATNPLPTIAALEAVSGDIALIAGGFDRGVDYSPLARAIAERGRVALIVMPTAGERIAQAVMSLVPDIALTHAQSMDEAVDQAIGALPKGGTVLLSPAAPSFSQYANWEERSADFRRTVLGTAVNSSHHGAFGHEDS